MMRIPISLIDENGNNVPMIAVIKGLVVTHESPEQDVELLEEADRIREGYEEEIPE